MLLFIGSMVYDGVLIQKAGTFDAVGSESVSDRVDSFFKLLDFLIGSRVKQGHLHVIFISDFGSADTKQAEWS